MKDMIKSKWLITFVIFVLGITYINACCMEKQNEQIKNASAESTDNINYTQK